jgi:hypothetical protein
VGQGGVHPLLSEYESNKSDKYEDVNSANFFAFTGIPGLYLSFLSIDRERGADGMNSHK